MGDFGLNIALNKSTDEIDLLSLPQRDHVGYFPAETTGQIHTPAGPETPIETRYPNIMQQIGQVQNLTPQQMTQIQTILQSQGAPLTPQVQQQFTQAPANNDAS